MPWAKMTYSLMKKLDYLESEKENNKGINEYKSEILGNIQKEEVK